MSPQTRARVCIIALAYKTTARLLKCVESIYRSAPAVSFELRLVMNEVRNDEIYSLTQQYPGATVITSPVNLGFARGCNIASEGTRAEFLVFINDDATVEPGWLDGLVACAQREPDAAAVGSKILFPDGRLQEAGSLVWRDGSTVAIGRGMPADRPELNVVRSAPYCSANGLLVRVADWKNAGGFDTSYYPAYYEDVDLCFALRHRLGRRVLYEPRARIVHTESSSTDTHFRKFLFKKNRQQFVRKWTAELASYSDAPASPVMIPYESGRTRVLIIDDRLPDNGIGSGFGRFEQLIRDCSQDTYSLHFFATAIRQKSTILMVDRGITSIESLEENLRKTRYDAVLISRPHNFLQHGNYVRKLQPQAALIYDAEALYHRRLVREGRVRDAATMQSAERRIAREADLIVTVAEEEQRELDPVAEGPVLLQLPIDAEIEPSQPAFHERAGVAFVAGWLGGADSPNVTALKWFVDSVLPHVQRAIPDCEIYVTGANPPVEIQMHAQGKVRFLGFVQDLRSLYARVRTVIAPIQWGAGTKIKTLEALQYGVPVVSTKVGAEGLPDYAWSAVIVADDPADFAEQLIRLQTSPDCWNKSREHAITAAQTLVQHRVSWDSIITKAIASGRMARGDSARETTSSPHA